MNSAEQSRRTGDLVEIPGDYQFRAVHEGWAPQRFWHIVRVAESLRLLNVRPGDMVLDVGCGSGMFTTAAGKIVDTKVLGIDANEAAIEFASKKFGTANVSFRKGMLDELDLSPGSVDKLAFLEVIEHIPILQAQRTLASFHRVMKKGGRLVISTPNRRSLWPLLELVLDKTRLTPVMEEAQHVMIYDRNALKELVEGQGFRSLNSITVSAAAPWFASLGMGIANFVHKVEQRLSCPWGGILIQAFEKE